MFSVGSAPFFHYGQNLPFPNLTKAFTDHLPYVLYQKNKLFLNQKMVLMKSGMLFLKNGLWMKHKF
jgi:hypothetical protein